MKKISVITLVYNEAEITADVYNEIKNVFQDLLKKGYDYEHIFMDNGSFDGTISILNDIASKDKRVKVLVYSKNFEVLNALMTGYKYTSGDAVICYEPSLKDPADLIPTFINYWEKGYDVVYGVRNKTADSLFLFFMRKIFYRLINVVSKEKLPLDAGDFRLTDRKVINELTKLDDYKPYIRGLITSIGFKQIGINYMRKPRLKGKSKSSLGYLIDFAINALISYSVVPIRMCTYAGLILSFFSILAAIVYLVVKLFFWPAQIPALAAVIYIILFFSGIQLFFLGIIGEYVGAIHSQVRKKPFVIIREKINFE